MIGHWNSSPEKWSQNQPLRSQEVIRKCSQAHGVALGAVLCSNRGWTKSSLGVPSTSAAAFCSMVLEFYGSMVPCFCGYVVLWFFDLCLICLYSHIHMYKNIKEIEMPEKPQKFCKLLVMRKDNILVILQSHDLQWPTNFIRAAVSLVSWLILLQSHVRTQ